jgi:hypothetical protein
MKPRNTFRTIAPALLLLAAMLLTVVPGCRSNTTPPPTTTGEDLHFSGVIQSKSATSWVIGGQTFKVDSYTRLDSGLDIGVTARVEYIIQADGAKLATEIQTP